MAPSRCRDVFPAITRRLLLVLGGWLCCGLALADILHKKKVKFFSK